MGLRDGLPGAMAERALVPAVALRRLPDGLEPAAGALVEPAGSVVRALRASGAGRGDRVCVWGSGTLGLLAVQFAVADGLVVDVVGVRPEQLAIARTLGARATFGPDELPDEPYEAVIDVSTGEDAPAAAVELVEPAGRVVLVGLSERPSLLDTRRAVLRDVSVVGVLAASAGLERAIELAEARVLDPGPIVAEVVGLEEVADVLRGARTAPGGAPKTHVDPGR
jgi:threonine dehydrogenase-like Zn-dependent dehydrogenase